MMFSVTGGIKRIGYVLLLLSLTGCHYLENRGNDVLDMFRLEGAYGYGLHVGVEATDYLPVGLGVYVQPYYFGKLGRGRTVRGSSRAEGVDWLVFHFRESGAVPPPGVSRKGALVASAPSADQVTQEPYTSESGFWFGLGVEDESQPSRRWPERFEITARTHLVLLGFGVGFNPVECLDFFAGWTTLDLCNDDGCRVAFQALEDERTCYSMRFMALLDVQEELNRPDSTLKAEELANHEARILYTLLLSRLRQALAAASPQGDWSEEDLAAVRRPMLETCRTLLQEKKFNLWKRQGELLVENNAQVIEWTTRLIKQYFPDRAKRLPLDWYRKKK